MRRTGSGGLGVRKGAWTEEEDALLKKCVHLHGVGNWHKVPLRAGLNRCRKSCRLRWYNYLDPNIKRGEFSSEEIDLIIKMHKLLGNRWSLIAGRIPGRTANDIKNQWNSHIFRKLHNQNKHLKTRTTTTTPVITKVVKPKALSFSKNSQWIKRGGGENALQSEIVPGAGSSALEIEGDHSTTWLEKLLFDEEDGKGSNSMVVSTDEVFTSFYVDGVEFANPNEGSVFSKEAENVWTDMCLDLLES